MEFNIDKIRHANNENWKRRENGGNRQPNKKVRTLREKETYKLLDILELDTIKQEEMKEKKKSENERESFKPSSATEFSSKR